MLERDKIRQAVDGIRMAHKQFAKTVDVARSHLLGLSQELLHVHMG